MLLVKTPYFTFTITPRLALLHDDSGARSKVVSQCKIESFSHYPSSQMRLIHSQQNSC